MLSEANSNQAIIRDNLLMSLGGLLKSSSFVPGEFTGSKKTQIEGTETNIEQAKELIKRAREIDYDKTKTAVYKILEEYKSKMPGYFYDDLINFMRLHD